MIFGVAPMTCAERFATLGNVFFNGHVGVAEHDAFGLTSFGGKYFELLAAVAGFAFLDAAGFVYLHKSSTRLADLARYFGIAQRKLLTHFGHA